MTTENQEEIVGYWGILLGEGGKWVEHGKKGKYIAIGWHNLGNLEWLANMGRN